MLSVPKKTTWHKTKAHKVPAYMDWLHNGEQRCIVCGSSNIEAHHVKNKAQRTRDDRLCICLCTAHHTGAKFSIHKTPREFKKMFSEEVLFALANGKYAEFLEKSK